MKLSDFDYHLPRELIAQYPAESRDASRLLALDRKTKKVTHGYFKDLISYLTPDDILVLNNTRVINARLQGWRRTGGRVEIFLLENIGFGKYKVLLKPSGRIKEGEIVHFGTADLSATIETKSAKEKVVSFRSTSSNIEDLLQEVGQMPLPPYIKRKTVPSDSRRYQTVYASIDGATAAPTAGLHFTEEMINKVRLLGTKISYVTLHVNYGTFAPITEEDVSRHAMHTENYELTASAANDINSVRMKGGRVIAVGTTTCRVLETCAVQEQKGQRPRVPPSPKKNFTGDMLRRTGKGQGRDLAWRLEPKRGKTDLFIYPGYTFRMTDTLLTNFHLPKSTLLLLVCAFASRDFIYEAYSEAIEKSYRFFSYGDAMLIL